jgi:hypothetical protein
MTQSIQFLPVADNLPNGYPQLDVPRWMALSFDFANICIVSCLPSNIEIWLTGLGDLGSTQITIISAIWFWVLLWA